MNRGLAGPTRVDAAVKAPSVDGGAVRDSLFVAHAVRDVRRDEEQDPFSSSTRITASIETVDNDRSVLSQAAGAFS